MKFLEDFAGILSNYQNNVKFFVGEMHFYKAKIKKEGYAVHKPNILDQVRVLLW